MPDREFTEVDLRSMLEQAESLRADVEEGRWRIRTRHAGRVWEVVVEPEADLERLVVITAYEVEH